jgi:hypothetical protein
MDAPAERSMRRRSLNQSKRIGSVSNLLAFGPDMADADGAGGGRHGSGGGARPLSTSMELAFLGWTSHGQACYAYASAMPMPLLCLCLCLCLCYAYAYAYASTMPMPLLCLCHYCLRADAHHTHYTSALLYNLHTRLTRLTTLRLTAPTTLTTLTRLTARTVSYACTHRVHTVGLPWGRPTYYTH